MARNALVVARSSLVCRCGRDTSGTFFVAADRIGRARM